MPNKTSIPHFSGNEAENLGRKEEMASFEKKLHTPDQVLQAANFRVGFLEKKIDNSDATERKVFAEKGEAGFGNSQQFLVSTLEKIRPITVSSEEERILQERQIEIAQRKEVIRENQASKLAEGIWKDEKVAEEKMPSLQAALAPWATQSDLLGLDGFMLAWHDPNTTPEERRRLQTVLEQSGLQRNEIEAFLYVGRKLSAEYHARINEITIVDTAFAKAEAEGVDVLADIFAGVEDIEPGDEAAYQEFLQQRVVAMAKTDDNFQQLLETQQRQEVVLQVIEQKIAVEQASRQPPQSAEAVASALENAGVGAKFNSLSAPAKAALENIVRQGGTAIVAPMLRGSVQPSDNGYIAEVSGVDVELNVQDGNLYIVGEHARENLVNRGEYKIDSPTASGFDQTYVRMIVDQNFVSSLTMPGMQQILLGMAGKFGEDAENTTLISEDEANRFHNAIELFFGNDDIEASEEMRRMERLGIIGSAADGDNSFTVNNQRMERIHRAMAEYIPRSLDARKAHTSLGLDYRHFQALADVWNFTGDDTILPKADVLQRLTEGLLESPTERTQQIADFCKAEGYLED